MALPLEITEFYEILRGLWMSFPLMVRQVFYLSVIAMGVLGVLKDIR